MNKKQKLAFKTRKNMLLYYLKAAKTGMAIVYWSARLDELDKLRKLLVRKSS